MPQSWSLRATHAAARVHRRHRDRCRMAVDRTRAAAGPRIGFLSNASPEVYGLRLSAFRRGLQETGFVEGQNVRIEYRWANGENARLGALAMELVNRRVAVIVAGGGTPAAMVAKAVVKTIPVVFAVAV